MVDKHADATVANMVVHGDAMHFRGEPCYLCDHKPVMTVADIAKESASVRYRYLNSFWCEGGDLLNSLLPEGLASAEICAEFQRIRCHIQDVLIDEMRSRA